MQMRRLMRDRITLIKQTGERWEGIFASVQPALIVIDDAKLPIEEGDTILRCLPNGLEEEYEIVDRGFHSGIHSIPDHYQAKVRKKTSIATASPQQIVYNVTGPNSRINVNSRDSSVNVVNVAPDTLFEEIRSALTAASDAQTEALLERLAELKRTQGSGDYLGAYQRFITAAANHMTLIAPFISALAQLLPK